MNRRNFLFGLAGLSALAATPASAQVWRKVCLANTLVTDCPIYTPPVTGKGYFGGGNGSGVSYNFIDGINFNTEAAINPTAVLSDGHRSSMSGVNSAQRGYFCGGFQSSPTYMGMNAIDGIRFDTEAAINPAAVLQDGAREGVAGVQSGAL